MSENNQTNNNTSGEKIQPNNNESKPVRTRFIIISIIVILIGGISIYFYLNPAKWNGFTSAITPGSDTTVKGVTDTSAGKDIDSASVDSTAKKMDTTTKNTEPEEDINKWGLRRPCFVISHSAYTKEPSAEKVTEKLFDMGFNSGYYWIPDYKPGGKKLFKVYVGPYQTRKDAKAMLSAVKKIQPDAYITKVKEEY